MPIFGNFSSDECVTTVAQRILNRTSRMPELGTYNYGRPGAERRADPAGDGAGRGGGALGSGAGNGAGTAAGIGGTQWEAGSARCIVVVGVAAAGRGAGQGTVAGRAVRGRSLAPVPARQRERHQCAVVAAAAGGPATASMRGSGLFAND